jgi:hypothetical protein
MLQQKSSNVIGKNYQTYLSSEQVRLTTESTKKNDELLKF